MHKPNPSGLFLPSKALYSVGFASMTAYINIKWYRIHIMCSLEHNEEGIFSQNMIAKFGVQVLHVFKYKYKHYINCF